MSWTLKEHCLDVLNNILSQFSHSKNLHILFTFINPYFSLYCSTRVQNYKEYHYNSEKFSMKSIH